MWLRKKIKNSESEWNLAVADPATAAAANAATAAALRREDLGQLGLGDEHASAVGGREVPDALHGAVVPADGVVQLDAEPSLVVVDEVHSPDESYRAVALHSSLGEVTEPRCMALPKELVTRGHLQN